MGSGGSRALLRHSQKSQEPRRGWGTAREADDLGGEGHQGEGTAYHTYRNPRRLERTQTHNQDVSRSSGTTTALIASTAPPLYDSEHFARITSFNPRDSPTR